MAWDMKKDPISFDKVKEEECLKFYWVYFAILPFEFTLTFYTNIQWFGRYDGMMGIYRIIQKARQL